MTLKVSNALPGSDIWIGTNDDEKICLLVFWESFSEINTGNILMHQWIINKHQNMVETYEQFDDLDTF